MHFVKGDLDVSYFSLVTTVGTPQDVTLQEIRVECFFPTALGDVLDDRDDQPLALVEQRRLDQQPALAHARTEQRRGVQAREQPPVGQLVERRPAARPGGSSTTRREELRAASRRAARDGLSTANSRAAASLA